MLLFIKKCIFFLLILYKINNFVTQTTTYHTVSSMLVSYYCI